MKQELDGVKKSLRDVEKSIEAAWDSINDIQEEIKTHIDYKKKCQRSLDSHRQELDLLKVNLKKADSQQAEIEKLKTKLLEEQEKIIALENYSRRENLRFMNVPECKDENCVQCTGLIESFNFFFFSIVMQRYGCFPYQTKFFSLRVLLDPTNLSVSVGNVYFFPLVIQISCILETFLRFSIAFMSIHELSHITPN